LGQLVREGVGVVVPSSAWRRDNEQGAARRWRRRGSGVSTVIVFHAPLRLKSILGARICCLRHIWRDDGGAQRLPSLPRFLLILFESCESNLIFVLKLRVDLLCYVVFCLFLISRMSSCEPLTALL
jgi:hypothetical protein